MIDLELPIVIDGTDAVVYGYTRLHGFTAMAQTLDGEQSEQKIVTLYQDRLMLSGYRWGGIIDDPHVAGLTSLKHREGGARLLKTAKVGHAIVVDGLYRLAATERELITTLIDLRHRKIDLIDLGEPTLLEGLRTFRIKMKHFHVHPLRGPRLPVEDTIEAIRKLRRQHKPFKEIAAFFNSEGIRGEGMKDQRWNGDMVYEYLQSFRLKLRTQKYQGKKARRKEQREAEREEKRKAEAAYVQEQVRALRLEALQRRRP